MTWKLEQREGRWVAIPSGGEFQHVACTCEVYLWLRLQAAEKIAEVRREALSSVSKALGEML